MKYLLVLAGLSSAASAATSTLWVASTFPQHGAIPRAFTCDGAEREPPLFWSGAPDGTRSFAIVVEDVEVYPPRTQWLLTVPGNLNAIEGVPEGADVSLSWDAPCPPRGRAHHYVFRVFALDTVLDAPAACPLAFEDAIQGHILASGELVGLYQHD
jgi:phosphatidylethanolamine-binding protein (PEBP) family uncharacterized protein